MGIFDNAYIIVTNASFFADRFILPFFASGSKLRWARHCEMDFTEDDDDVVADWNRENREVHALGPPFFSRSLGATSISNITIGFMMHNMHESLLMCFF